MNPSPLDKYNKPPQVINEPSPSELIVSEMLSTKGIRTKTDLNDNLIVALSKGSIYAKLFKSKNMGLLVNYISEYRVSRNRLGRTEMKEMVRSLSTVFEEEKQSKSINAKLFGV
jgi:hypothetical protein